MELDLCTANSAIKDRREDFFPNTTNKQSMKIPCRLVDMLYRVLGDQIPRILDTLATGRPILFYNIMQTRIYLIKKSWLNGGDIIKLQFCK